jgi:hypothetical protein
MFLEGIQIIQAGAALDPAVAGIPNGVATVRDVLESIGWSNDWLNSPEAIEAAAAAEAQDAQAQQMLDSMGQAAAIAKDFSGAVPSGI